MKTRTLTIALVASLSFAAMAPALAQPEGLPTGPPEDVTTGVPAEAPDGESVAETNQVDGEAVGAEQAAAGEAIAAQRQAFALEAQTLAQTFAALVDEWTSCIADEASANEESGEGVDPRTECGDLDVTQSAGHAISVTIS